MRFSLLFISALTANLAAQSITRVDYRVLPGNLIEITYTLRDSEPDGFYRIHIAASLDGGYSFPIIPGSITGDVGNVHGPGIKAILWKVLDDLPALTTDALVFKISGRTRATARGFFRSLVSGNRLTKRLSNGVTFYAGRSLTARYEDRAFRDLISEGLLIAGPEGKGGLKITSVPFIYRFEGMARLWGLGYSGATLQKLRLLSYGDPSYKGEKLRLYQLGLAASVAYTPLPVFGLFLPHIGVGGAVWRHSIGHEVGSEFSVTNSASAFVEMGIQGNPLRWLKVTFGGRKYYLAPRYDTLETFLEIVLHISRR